VNTFLDHRSLELREHSHHLEQRLAGWRVTDIKLGPGEPHGLALGADDQAQKSENAYHPRRLQGWCKSTGAGRVTIHPAGNLGRQALELEYASRKLTTIEINKTFYATQKAERAAPPLNRSHNSLPRTR
jgi:hypothetical protein